MQHQFVIQGSSADPYVVEFSYSESKFNAICSCPAGGNLMLCKHVLSIIEGVEPKGLLSGNANKIPEIALAFQQSDVSEVYNLYLTLFEEIELLKKELKNRKKQVARMLYK